jgi:hypothetical protein
MRSGSLQDCLNQIFDGARKARGPLLGGCRWCVMHFSWCRLPCAAIVWDAWRDSKTNPSVPKALRFPCYRPMHSPSSSTSMFLASCSRCRAIHSCSTQPSTRGHASDLSPTSSQSSLIYSVHLRLIHHYQSCDHSLVFQRPSKISLP